MQLEHDKSCLWEGCEVANPHVQEVDETCAPGHNQYVQPGHLVDARQQIEVDNDDERGKAGYWGSPKIGRMPSPMVENLPSIVIEWEEADEEDDDWVKHGLCFHPEEVLRIKVLSSLPNVVKLRQKRVEFRCSVAFSGIF